MRPPFFAFYPADFANDIKVEAMTTVGVGAYILLLCKAWQSEPPGSLPNDDQILARLARVDPGVWAEVRAAVLECFELRTDGRWHNPRLRREYDKSLTAMKARKKGGAKGAEMRWGDKDDTPGKLDGLPIGSPIRSAIGQPLGQSGRLEIGDGEREEEKTPLPPAKPGGGAGSVPLVVPFHLPPEPDSWVEPIEPWEELVREWVAARLPGHNKAIQRLSYRVDDWQARLRDPAWRAAWREAVQRAGRSRLCRGEDTTFMSRGLLLDWFLGKPKWVFQILNGDFDDQSVGGVAKSASTQSEDAIRRNRILALIQESKDKGTKPKEDAA